MDTIGSSRLDSKRFWTDNAALGLATIVAGLFNSAYSVLLAHALGPRAYGWIGALNNLVSLFLLPLPIIGLGAIRLGKQERQGWLLAATLGMGLAVFGIAAALSGRMSQTLHVPHDLIILFAASTILNFAYALYVGFLKRARRYGWVGFLLVMASLLAVAAVAGSVTVGHAAPIAWLGILQLTAVVLMFILVLWTSRNLPVIPPTRLEPAVVATTLGVGTLQAIWGISDVLFAKARLSAIDAGFYTGLSTIGQALPFVVSSLATVMLTAILDAPDRRRYYLGRTMAASLGLAVLFLGVLMAFPAEVVRLALGEAFVPMSHYVQTYSLAMTALAVILVLTTYGVAVGAYLPMVGAALGTGVWVYLLAGSHTMAMLVDRTAAAMGGTLALVGLVFLLKRQKSRPPEGDRPAV